MTYPTEPTKAMLLCALHRNGAPATSATLHDIALKLMQAEGWPRRSWANLSAQGASTTLRAMLADGLIKRAIETTVNGRLTPQYTLDRFDPRSPPPPAPDPEGEDHPLHGKTKRQQYVLFDVQDVLLQTMARQRDEAHDMVQRHIRELGNLVERQRLQLGAVGLTTEVA